MRKQHKRPSRFWQFLMRKAVQLPPQTAISSYARHVWRDWDFSVYSREGYAANPYVYRGFNLIAWGVGRAKLRLFERGIDNPQPMPDDHALLQLLRRPNTWMSGQFFRVQQALHLLIGGRSLLIKVGPQTGSGGARDNVAGTNRAPRRLDIVTPARFDYALSTMPSSEWYPFQHFEYHAGQSNVKYSPADIVYTRMPHPEDPCDGMPALRACAHAVDITNEADIWNMSLLKQGGMPPGALTVDGALNDEQFERGKEQIKNSIQGAHNAGIPALLEGGAKWQAFSYDPDKMGWDKLKLISAREVSLVAGVPPELNGDPTTKTYDNTRMALRSLARDGIIPMLELIIGELNTQLVPDFARDPRDPEIYLAYDPASIEGLVEDESERIERAVRAVGGTVLTPDEARAALGLDARPGGDQLLVNGKMTPLSDLMGEGDVEE